MALAGKNGLRLEYATLNDAEAIAPIFFLSFHDHAYFRRMMPDTADARTAWAAAFCFAVRDPMAICLKVTDEDTGRIVGHGRWVRPKQKVEDEQPGHEEERWSALDPYIDVETGEALFGSFERNRREMMQERRHYCKFMPRLHFQSSMLTFSDADMELLMTAEGYKGRGGGGLMVEHGTALADQEQVECYIDASPAGRALYERHGFVFTKQENLPMDYHYNFGIREPKGK